MSSSDAGVLADKILEVLAGLQPHRVACWSPFSPASSIRLRRRAAIATRAAWALDDGETAMRIDVPGRLDRELLVRSRPLPDRVERRGAASNLSGVGGDLVPGFGPVAGWGEQVVADEFAVEQPQVVSG